MELCEVLTLESNEKDSTNEHGNFTFDIPQKPCSFNATPESGMFSALLLTFLSAITRNG